MPIFGEALIRLWVHFTIPKEAFLISIHNGRHNGLSNGRFSPEVFLITTFHFLARR